MLYPLPACSELRIRFSQCEFFRVALILVGFGFMVPASGNDVNSQIDYLAEVKPLLKRKCYACHGAQKQKGGLRLDTGKLIRKGGENGAALVPGNSGDSLLLKKVSATEETDRMPQEATDELGFHVVQDRHYVTDIHATILHQLGLDPRGLEVPGHKRLDIDFGEPIHDIIA